MADDIKFVEVDSKTIENELIQGYENATGETLYPGDERRIFLLQEIPIIVAMKNDVNETGKQNLLRYAVDEMLDALGEFQNTPRLQAQKTLVTLRYTLSNAQATDVIVPTGSRVTPDGTLYFATLVELIIPSGQTYGDIKAEAMEPGEKYNDYTPGQIKNMVDVIPYVASVVNTDESGGGSDIENNERYRERIRQAPESFSVAGPEGAYVYWAKTADSNIVDISVSSPSPGVVKIVPLLINGEVPSQAILDKINTAVSAKDRRPLTDNVQVVAPIQVIYNIDLTYYISSSRQTEEAVIRSEIEDTGGAIEKYKACQCEKLGRAINPDELRYRLMQAGAYRAVITSPIYTAMDTNSVAKIGTVNIIYGGLE